MLKFVYLIGFFAVPFVTSSSNETPNYDIQFISLETMEGSETYFEYNYTLDKQSELTFKMSGNIRQLVQLGDDYGVTLTLSRSDLADDPPVYEEMMNINKPVCDYMKTIYRMYFYDGLKDVSNFPHYETCPLVPAEYWFKDYIFEGEDFAVFLREGRFKLECYLTKEGESLAGCISTSTVTKVD
ncbi:uncharacterized protein LOC131677245 [Topomyia yanbarensis]|uniref:uncharacterized protein LOC131677245 n=1 Tax=Topomyia yanbarensis TaxID=2498891 RepID=UPI00273BD62C|nr:uncharacterized protein LOC131677245 [Topomyia yanbarensis]